MDYDKKKQIDDKKTKQETKVLDEKAKKQEELRKCFAKRLKYACKDRNKTIYKIAQQTGLSSGLLGSYSEAKKSPSIYNAKIIADNLGVSLDWLCGDGDSLSVTPWSNYQIAVALLAILERFEPKIKISDNKPDVLLSFSFENNFDNKNVLRDFLKAYLSLNSTINELDGTYEEFTDFYIKLLKKYENKL